MNVHWMDLCGGDRTFYRDLFGWEPDDSGVFTVAGEVVAGHGALGGPGWNPHVVVDDVAVAGRTAQRLGGAVVREADGVAVLVDPAGAEFVVRASGRWADRTHRPMAFSWAELCTPETAVSRSFYCGLFAWGATDIVLEMPSGPVGYTVFTAGAGEAAGLLPAEGAFGPATPPYWLAYVEVTDTDAVAAAAEASGGAVVVEPFDIPRIGRVALLAGRSGETFAVMRLPAPVR